MLNNLVKTKKSGSLIIKVEQEVAKAIAYNIKKGILKNPKIVKNRIYRLMMIDFFLLDYCKDKTKNYLFYSDIEHRSLMCIAENPRQEVKVSSDYAFIECVVKGVGSNVSFSDYLNKAKSIKNGKVALGSAPILYDFYKGYGFVFIRKYMENWSSIGETEPKESYVMVYNKS